jgi:hypothetical protein
LISETRAKGRSSHNYKKISKSFNKIIFRVPIEKFTDFQIGFHRKISRLSREKTLYF